VRVAWFAVPLVLLFGGCSSCRKATPPEETVPATLVVDAPVAAPEGLLAELVVPAPDETWGKLQRGIGGATALFPTTTGGLICAVAGIDPSLGSEIDGASPVYGALAQDQDDVAYALAVKLVEPRRAQTVLVDAEGARYAAKEEAGMTILSAKGGAPLRTAIALARGGYLIVAGKAADLTRLGPYVHRTLPKRPLPATSAAIEIPHAALAGAVKTKLLSDWAAFRADKEAQDAKMRREHGGRAPDFADPRAILGIIDGVVQSRVALLADLDRAKAEVEVGDVDIKAELTFVPMSGDGPASQLVASMHPAEARAVLEAPSDALLAIATHGAAVDRAVSARDFEDALTKALGDRLGADARKEVRAAVTDWSKGRGDDLTGWVTWGKEPKGIFFRTAAVDAEAATRAIHEALALATTPAFKEPLKTLLNVEGITFSASEAAGLGRVDLATLAFGKEQKNVKLALGWVAKGKDVSASLSDDPTSLLASGATSKQRLGDDAHISTAVTSLGANATFALVAQPLTLERTGAPAPLVFGWGRRGSNLWAHVEVSDLIARAAMKRAGGF
jgi:hypothetical protein